MADIDVVEIIDKKFEFEEDESEDLNHIESESHESTPVITILNSSIDEDKPELDSRSIFRSKRLARKYRKRNSVSSGTDEDDNDVIIDRVIKKRPRTNGRDVRRRSKKTRDITVTEIEVETDQLIVKKEENGSRSTSPAPTPDHLPDNDEDLSSSDDESQDDKEEKTEEKLIEEGIKVVMDFFDDNMCRKIEKKIDEMSEKAKCGLYKQKTYDRAPLRNKYFFGEGYTYGKQMAQKGPGQERLHKVGEVDEIPSWIMKHIIQKVYDAKIVPHGWINSCVINEYFPGGCIVSHIDPIHIFDRPIISINFNASTFLSFGVKFSFNPIRTSEPLYSVPLHRGQLTLMSGYAADKVTHCIRPQDITERRCVIILRRTYPDAPRVSDMEHFSSHHSRTNQHRHRSRTYEFAVDRSRKRRRGTDFHDHHSGNRGNDDDDDDHQTVKKRKSRHSL